MPSHTVAPKQVATPMPFDVLRKRLVSLLEHDDETGVADAVDLAISQGAYHGASDIHFEPWTDTVSMRFRIDGILHQAAIFPGVYHAKWVARIKVLADLVVYRRDIPQDGRVEAERTSSRRPMRVSTVPTIHGEKVVIRLLGDIHEMYALDSLGFQAPVVQSLRDIIARTQGTLLLTGPSSSGKTTTIYALIQEMLRVQQHTRNIVTIEDPVEYELDRVSQMQTNAHADFTFATALRAILRQDPEVIMVGEIRDTETAKMAVQAGLTGHFVVSTIHSGTAAGVFTRLLDMGIEPFLIASSLTGVLAQRLVRLNCAYCADTYTPEPVTLRHFDLAVPHPTFRKGKGCEQCQGIGYRGRASLGEFLAVSTDIAELVLGRPTTARLHAAAIESGMQTLAGDGLAKVHRGITTLEELVRVLPVGTM